jgi:hypothetical protein
VILMRERRTVVDNVRLSECLPCVFLKQSDNSVDVVDFESQLKCDFLA